MRKLESRRGPGSRTLLVWTWGKSDADIERAIADLCPGPDDIVSTALNMAMSHSATAL